MYLSSKALGPAPDQDFLEQLMAGHSVGRKTARKMLGDCLRVSQQRREASRQTATSSRAQSGFQHELITKGPDEPHAR